MSWKMLERDGDPELILSMDYDCKWCGRKTVFADCVCASCTPDAEEDETGETDGPSAA